MLLLQVLAANRKKALHTRMRGTKFEMLDLVLEP